MAKVKDNVVQSDDKLTTKYKDLHELANSRRIMGERFSKDYNKEIEKWLTDYCIESFNELDDDDLHNKLQIPYIFSTVESSLPSMFETVPALVMNQRGKLDRDFTEWTNDVWGYVKDITDLEENIEDAGMLFLITGLGQIEWGWDQENETVKDASEVEIKNEDGTVIDTQEVLKEVEVPVFSKPYLKVIKYGSLFYSPESVFKVDDNKNEIPYIVSKDPLNDDEIKETFGIKADDVDEKDFFNTKPLDIELDKDAAKLGVVKSDLKRITVYRYSGTLPKKVLKDDLKKDYKTRKVYEFYFTRSMMFTEPEEIEKKNYVLAGNYGTPFIFHRFGEPKILRKLEQDISFGRSTIADYRDKMHTKIFIPHGTTVDEELLKSPKKFTIVRYMGDSPPGYMKPGSIPEAVMVALQQSREDLQMTLAQLDLSRGGTQSIVDTATGQKIFQQATEKRIDRKRRKIAKVIRAIAKNLLKLCAENWDLDKFAKITDLSVEELEKMGYVEKLSQLGEEYDIDIDLESVTFNKATQSAQAIAMYDKTKDSPHANQKELLKWAMAKGFNEKDVDRFVSGELTPEELAQAIQQLSQAGLISPQVAQQMIMVISQQAQGGQGAGGRPQTGNPVDALNKSMPGADSNQITSQADASGKQYGQPKIQGA